jgi:hypothetical protein
MSSEAIIRGVSIVVCVAAAAYTSYKLGSWIATTRRKVQYVQEISTGLALLKAGTPVGDETSLGLFMTDLEQIAEQLQKVAENFSSVTEEQLMRTAVRISNLHLEYKIPKG